MKRLTAFVIAVLLSGTVGSVHPTGAVAAANRWPRNAVTCVHYLADMAAACTPVFANGEIGWPYGSAGIEHLTLKAPIAGADDSWQSGWLVAADGGVFAFSANRFAARFYGSMGGKHLNAPVVGIAVAGRGYWLVGRDGGIFSFGAAKFYGSMGSKHLNHPVVAMAATATRRGYWMVARDGGVFRFGDARYLGSLPGRGLHVTDVVGIAPTSTNQGYWIARTDGHIYPFGDAKDLGSYPAPTDNPVVSIESTMVRRQGYCLVLQTGAVLSFGLSYGLCGS
jgi:hypothetical protein